MAVKNYFGVLNLIFRLVKVAAPLGKRVIGVLSNFGAINISKLSLSPHI